MLRGEERGSGAGVARRRGGGQGEHEAKQYPVLKSIPIEVGFGVIY